MPLFDGVPEHSTKVELRSAHQEGASFRIFGTWRLVNVEGRVEDIGRKSNDHAIAALRRGDENVRLDFHAFPAEVDLQVFDVYARKRHQTAIHAVRSIQPSASTEPLSLMVRPSSSAFTIWFIWSN